MITVDLDGAKAFPLLTMGVMRIPEEDTVAAVHEAIALGYRSFDTSPVYGNEAATGEAIRSAPVSREALRWLIQRDALPVAKARSPAHMAANLQVDEFLLGEEELGRIDALDSGRSAFGFDPRTFEVPPGMEDVRP